MTANKHPKHYVTLIILAILLTVGIGGFYLNKIKALAESEISSNIADQVAQSNSYMTKALDKNFQILSHIAQFIQQQPPNSEALFANSLQLITGQYGFTSIILADSKGIIYQTAPRNFADQPTVLPQNNAISEPFSDASTGQNLVTFTLPLRKDGDIYGYIAGNKATDALQQELLSDFYDSRGALYLIQNNGQILLHSAQAELSQGNLYQLLQSHYGVTETDLVQLANALKNNQTGVQKMLPTGSNKPHTLFYLGYDTLSNKNDWNLVYCVPKSDTIALGKQITVVSMQLVCGAICFILLILLLLLHSEKAKRSAIEKILYTDDLTNIGNRAQFYHLVPKILRENPGQHYLLVHFDIHNFKYVNEHYGYHVGDLLLKSLALELDSRFRQDETCARVFNDHFLILGKNTPDFIAQLDQHLKSALRENVNSTICDALALIFGLYDIKDGDEPVVSMVDKATLALKEGKRQSPPQATYYNEQLATTLEKQKDPS